MKSLKFKKLNLPEENILRNEQMKSILGGDDGYGGDGGDHGCKDACVRGMTCFINNNPNGVCTHFTNCNGLDGKKYLVLYCEAP